jgi:hypothetical protein
MCVFVVCVFIGISSLFNLNIIDKHTLKIQDTNTRRSTCAASSCSASSHATPSWSLLLCFCRVLYCFALFCYGLPTLAALATLLPAERLHTLPLRGLSHTVLTLLLHCRYTAVTLLLHCSYTIVALSVHCCYTVVKPFLRFCCTAVMLFVHYTVLTLFFILRSTSSWCFSPPLLWFDMSANVTL